MTELQYKDAIAFFISFCVEIYKNAHSMTGEEASCVLANSGVLSWLESNYDILHTQSHYRILEEIEDYMYNRNTTKE